MTKNVNKSRFICPEIQTQNWNEQLRLSRLGHNLPLPAEILVKKALKYCKRPPGRKNPAARPETTWLSVTLNDMNSNGEVELAVTVWSRNSREEQDINKLGRLYSETKGCGRKWLTL